MSHYEIGGVKIAAGEAEAAEDLGLTEYAGDSVQHDQQAARDNLQSRPETATTKHDQQVVRPPMSTDPLFKEKVKEEIKKVGQAYPMQYARGRNLGYGRAPGPYGQFMGMRPIVIIARRPSITEKAKRYLQQHPELATLAGGIGGAGLGALGGHALEQGGVSGATLGGAGLGAAGGTALGLLGERKLRKRASLTKIGHTLRNVPAPARTAEETGYEIGGEKVAAKKEKDYVPDVSKKDLKRAYNRLVRTSTSPVKRSLIWDVGDVVGRKKGKEEYLPGAIVSMPLRKQGQSRPMTRGGDVAYTVGPTPEDVAQYLRTQQRGETAGRLAGAGLGAVGGAALGHLGGSALAGGLGGDHPLIGRLIPILTTAAGTIGGGAAGASLGGPAGRGVGSLIARGGPAAQIQRPFLTRRRAEDVANRLALVAAARGGRTPTVAVSPG